MVGAVRHIVIYSRQFQYMSRRGRRFIWRSFNGFKYFI